LVGKSDEEFVVDNEEVDDPNDDNFSVLLLDNVVEGGEFA
jgi:hypothetical protein